MARRIDFEPATPDNNYRLFRKSTSYVHIDQSREELGFGTILSASPSIYPVLNHNAQFRHLASEFFGATGCTHKGKAQPIVPIQYTADGILAVVDQASKYTDRSALVVASPLLDLTDENIRESGDQVIPASFSAHLPTETRTAYIGATLAGLQAANEYAGNEVPVAIEHNTPRISQLEMSFPRSIPLPHTHVGIVDVSNLQPRDTEIEHLVQEQELFTDAMTTILAMQMYAYLNEVLAENESIASQLTIAPRRVEPFGFGINFTDITPDNLNQRDIVNYVTDVMNAAHAGYDAFSQNGLSAELDLGFDTFFSQKQQPSYRLIYHLHPQNKNLVVAFSPVASRAGGMEAAGIELQRGSAYPLVHSKDAITVFQKAFGERVEDTLSTTSNGARQHSIFSLAKQR